MQEIAVALAMARGDITPDAPADGHALANAAIDAAMAYEVQCPVCHSKTDVYHDVWAVVRCPVALCTGEIINPHPDPDNVLTDVERAELDALNTQRSLERAKLILGNKHAVL
jgi:ribosomal protein S27E